MKYLKLAIPTSIFLMCILSLALAVYQQNSLAISAYITAMFGWLIISADEWFNYKTSELGKK